ncbi:glutathione S-transferase family protein [Pseudoduganella ginsengisoli]|uniref:Glutathione S-transferase family protein n=1 Tax=Pseudoduganella ginsengisoli TaxID=1462440 RepID=A0A6L6PZZ8_9BURK|nr:glutathione S-transferase family protein [Pseudoduganella ginsengisoli]MTW02816.1 glutathione S-transferase family protein [Pseudoduganella ginsengisoli]
MATFQLYGNCESGHSYKVKLAMEVAGVPHSYTEIDLKLDRKDRPEPFRTLAKYGEVPLLVHDGQAYVQSNAILLHLAEYLKAYGGESQQRLDRVREWLFWEANRIGFSMAHLRFGQKFDPAAYAGSVLPWFRNRFDSDITRLEEELSDGRRFLLDDQVSMADFSICGYMYWPEQANVSYPPKVHAWLDRIAALPGWRHPYQMEGAMPW